ncbi:MAG: hypothetical protein KFKLKKLM_00236 [Flavobacteriales bacterium]|nr:hypothetical protein [Flavobacteriales bacterium]
MAKAIKIYRNIILTPRLSVGLLKASLIQGLSLDSVLVSQAQLKLNKSWLKPLKHTLFFFSALKGGVINL